MWLLRDFYAAKLYFSFIFPVAIVLHCVMVCIVEWVELYSVETCCTYVPMMHAFSLIPRNADMTHVNEQFENNTLNCNTGFKDAVLSFTGTPTGYSYECDLTVDKKNSVYTVSKECEQVPHTVQMHPYVDKVRTGRAV